MSVLHGAAARAVLSWLSAVWMIGRRHVPMGLRLATGSRNLHGPACCLRAGAPAEQEASITVRPHSVRLHLVVKSYVYKVLQLAARGWVPRGSLLGRRNRHT